MSLVNRAQCKTYLLDASKMLRAGKFTRVGGDVWPWLESILRNRMYSLVHSHPSLGVTIYGPHKGRKEKTHESQ